MRRFLEIPRKQKNREWTECFVNIDMIDTLWMQKENKSYVVFVSSGGRVHTVLETKSEKEAREKYNNVLEHIRRAK